MANFDHLFCVNDSGFFFLETGKKIMMGEGGGGNYVVGPKRNNHHGSDKRSSTYANRNGYFSGQIPSLRRRRQY